MALIGLLLLGIMSVGIKSLSFFSLPAVAVPSEQAPALPLPNKPSIVVLPFVNLSQDPQQEYFSDGITADLITDLSKLSGLFVIARNSAFTYKGEAVKAQEISRELGVRYVLEGSVQKMDSQVRVTAQLVDATTGYYLWAERYDRPLTDIFTLQNEIRRKIITALKVKLTAEERERFRRSPTDNLEAYDYYLRGVESWWRWTKESNAQARQMFEKAIELDPLYAGAYGGLGRTYFNDWFFLWSQDLAQSLEQALEMARQAIALDKSLPGPHQLLGYISLWNQQYERAVAEAEQAIALNPNAADGYVNLANILAFTGRPKESIGLIEKAMRLNPRAPTWYLLSLGFAYRVAGQYQEATGLLKRVLSIDPDQVPAHFSLAICYAELGQQEEARAEVAEVLKLNPHYSLEVWGQRLPFKDPAVLQRTLAALRKAGLK